MIKWETRSHKIDQSDIIRVEKYFSIKFPADFIDIVLKHNGGIPNKKVYDFQNHKEAVFRRIFSFSPDDKNNIINVYENVKEQFPQKIIPFGDDPFGNLICFDYRSKCRIVFWNHELYENTDKAINNICDSFSEFLMKLYNPEDK